MGSLESRKRKTRKINKAMIFPEECEIGRLLRLKRTFDGYTQTELALKLKISVTCLSNIENGKRGIPKPRMAVVNQYIYKERYVDKQLVNTNDESAKVDDGCISDLE